jgi:hypothetical protein
MFGLSFSGSMILLGIAAAMLLVPIIGEAIADRFGR